MVYAYLMALLEINDKNEIVVRHFTISSDEHLTCHLQKQAYACVDKHSGDTYSEACKSLTNSIRSKMILSQSGSLWHAIASQLDKS